MDKILTTTNRRSYWELHGLAKREIGKMVIPEIEVKPAIPNFIALDYRVEIGKNRSFTVNTEILIFTN